MYPIKIRGKRCDTDGFKGTHGNINLGDRVYKRKNGSSYYVFSYWDVRLCPQRCKDDCEKAETTTRILNHELMHAVLAEVEPGALAKISCGEPEGTAYSMWDNIAKKFSKYLPEVY